LSKSKLKIKIIMSKDERDEVEFKKSSVNIKAIAGAARNADNLDELALELETVNPMKLHLRKELFMLKSVPVNDSKGKGNKKKDFSPRCVGIKSIVISSLCDTVKAGYVTINSSIDIPESGHRVLKLDEAIFDSEEDARAVGICLTEIELEKAKAMRDEAQEAVDFIENQLKKDRI
jgi:hypothetical protein